MLGSTVLDVAIGVILTFLAVSLAASAITEAISSALKWREKTLLDGIVALVNDRDVALGLYNDALVNPLGSGAAKCLSELTRKPAYIEAKDFAAALYGILHAPVATDGDGTGKPERTANGGMPPLVATITDPQIKAVLTALWEGSDKTVKGYKLAIGQWFDRAMDRLSGWYKQRTQLATFVAGLVVAASLNTNILYMGGQIWSRPGVIAGLESGALDKIGEALKACDFGKVKAPDQAKPAETPAEQPAAAPSAGKDACFEVKGAIEAMKAANLIGWVPGPAPTEPVPWLMAVLSWLVVAGATLFGASFWFDLLQRVTQLRGTGLVARRTDGSTSKPDISGPDIAKPDPSRPG